MGTFSETFDRMFADIFGLKPEKPRTRVTEVMGAKVWECAGCGRRGWGATPLWAYRHWERLMRGPQIPQPRGH